MVMKQPEASRAEGKVPGTTIRWHAVAGPGDFWAEIVDGSPDGIGLYSVQELDALIKTLKQIKAFAEAE